jgi:hypothetical protein
VEKANFIVFRMQIPKEGDYVITQSAANQQVSIRPLDEYDREQEELRQGASRTRPSSAHPSLQNRQQHVKSSSSRPATAGLRGRSNYTSRAEGGRYAIARPKSASMPRPTKWQSRTDGVKEKGWEQMGTTLRTGPTGDTGERQRQQLADERKVLQKQHMDLLQRRNRRAQYRQGTGEQDENLERATMPLGEDLEGGKMRAEFKQRWQDQRLALDKEQQQQQRSACLPGDKVRREEAEGDEEEEEPKFEQVNHSTNLP